MWCDIMFEFQKYLLNNKLSLMNSWHKKGKRRNSINVGLHFNNNSQAEYKQLRQQVVIYHNCFRRLTFHNHHHCFQLLLLNTLWQDRPHQGPRSMWIHISEELDLNKSLFTASQLIWCMMVPLDLSPWVTIKSHQPDISKTIGSHHPGISRITPDLL